MGHAVTHPGGLPSPTMDFANRACSSYEGRTVGHAVTRPVGVAVKILLTAQEVLGSIPGLVNLVTASQTARHCCDVTSELCCPGAELRI